MIQVLKDVIAEGVGYIFAIIDVIGLVEKLINHIWTSSPVLLTVEVITIHQVTLKKSFLCTCYNIQTPNYNY
jgi:hypothetical protein